MSNVRLLLGDCLDILPTLAANSVHSIVCDPPYGLSFMGKDWDYGVPGVAFWQAAYRVAKPGAMLLAFGGTRTYHRLTCAIEDAGWEIRDCLMWLHGQGFPKSLDIGKAIDKAAGAEREVIGTVPLNAPGGSIGATAYNNGNGRYYPEQPRTITAPATDAARQWDGFGTNLKPAFEPIVLAMKPIDKNFANNALVHGVAGLNVGACRIEANGETPRGSGNGSSASIYGQVATSNGNGGNVTPAQGRWPSNVLLDEESAAALDEMSGERRSAGLYPATRITQNNNSVYQKGVGNTQGQLYEDSGGASRFFAVFKDEPSRMAYFPKASRRDRNEGLEGMPERPAGALRSGDGGWRNEEARGRQPRHDSQHMAQNHHPTVKPTQLMRYLCRLVTPPRAIEFVCPSCYNTPSEHTRRCNNEGQNLQSVREDISQQTQHGDLLLERVQSQEQDYCANELPDMQQTNDKGGGDLLLAGLRESSDANTKDLDAASMRTMRKDIYAQEGWGTEILQPPMFGNSRGAEEAESTCQDDTWVSDALPPRSSNGDKGGLCDGASVGDGRTLGADTGRARGGTSHQRGQKRQPNRKLAADAENGTRQVEEATASQRDRVSALPGTNKPEQSCPTCGAALVPVERPGIVLDPFAGSGSTGKAAVLEGFDFVGIELDAEYMEIARRRIEHAQAQATETVPAQPALFEVT